MRHISTSSDVQISQPSNLFYIGLTFSPGGDYLYYSTWDRHTPISLYQMPVLGGPPRKIITDIDSVVTFSPDGKQVAFLRGDPAQRQASVIVANADGTGERKLTTHKIDDLFLVGPSYLGPSWSPDGEMVAFGLWDSREGASDSKLMAVRTKDGIEKVIASQPWSKVGVIRWLRDGSGLVLIATEQEDGSNGQIWYVSYPGGQVGRITNDWTDYQSLSVSEDSSALITVKNEGVSNMWTAVAGNANSAFQISSNKYDGLHGMSWTPDGKIVYVSRASGNPEIWIMNADGTNNKQLTFDVSRKGEPSVSPDGRYIVFTSTRAGVAQ